MAAAFALPCAPGSNSSSNVSSNGNVKSSKLHPHQSSGDHPLLMRASGILPKPIPCPCASGFAFSEAAPNPGNAISPFTFPNGGGVAPIPKLCPAATPCGDAFSSPVPSVFCEPILLVENPNFALIPLGRFCIPGGTFPNPTPLAFSFACAVGEAFSHPGYIDAVRPISLVSPVAPKINSVSPLVRIS